MLVLVSFSLQTIPFFFSSSIDFSFSFLPFSSLLYHVVSFVLYVVIKQLPWSTLCNKLLIFFKKRDMMSYMSQSVTEMCLMLHVVTVTPSCDTKKIVESSRIDDIISYLLKLA